MRKIVGALTLAVLLTGCGASDGDQAGEPTRTVTVTASPEDPDAPAKWESDDSATGRDPVAEDFVLKVRIKSKECFGSAGCSVGLEVVPSMTDLSLLEGHTVELTYKLTGTEDSLIDTIEFDEDGNYSSQVQSVSTTDSGAKIKAKVTDVLVR